MGGRPGKLPVLNVLRTGLPRLALLLAVGVDEGVGEDPVEPRLEVRPLLELVERSEGFGERLLDEVLRVRRIAGHPQRRRVQLVQERHGVSLEPSRPVLNGLLTLTQPRRPPCTVLPGGNRNLTIWLERFEPHTCHPRRSHGPLPEQGS